MALRNTKAAADKAHVSVSFLEHARQTGKGPRYLKIGGKVLYRDEDIEAWLEAQARTRVWDFGGGEAA